jgi:hypothetical protein
MSDIQGREQHQDKEATHDFQRLHLHVLHVSARLALKAAGMLESGTVSPLIIDELNVGGSGDRHIGQQDRISVFLRMMNHHGPHILGICGETQSEPAELNRDLTCLWGVGKLEKSS